LNKLFVDKQKILIYSVIHQGDNKQMRKLLEQCPACGGELVVTQQSCTECGTVIMGQFKPNLFSRLSPENLKFLEVFVKNRGNVKDMERELGWSYWTIRNRLNEVIEALGFETAQVDEAEMAQQRQEILAQLNRGEIGVNEAAQLLSQLRT
jgi:hypothetical protein